MGKITKKDAEVEEQEMILACGIEKQFLDLGFNKIDNLTERIKRKLYYIEQWEVPPMELIDKMLDYVIHKILYFKTEQDISKIKQFKRPNPSETIEDIKNQFLLDLLKKSLNDFSEEDEKPCISQTDIIYKQRIEPLLNRVFKGLE
jgi:hypothetical protein